MMKPLAGRIVRVGEATKGNEGGGTLRNGELKEVLSNAANRLGSRVQLEAGPRTQTMPYLGCDNLVLI